MSSKAQSSSLQQKTAHSVKSPAAKAEQADAPLASRPQANMVQDAAVRAASPSSRPDSNVAMPAHAQPVSPAQNVLKPSRLAVPKPLYSQVRDALLERIRGGEWGVGATLPNEFTLATDFGVSIGTIRRAIEGIEESGILKRIQGRGTFVSGPGQMALQDKFCRLRRLDGVPVELAHTLHKVSVRAAAPSEGALLSAGEPGEVIEIVQHVGVAGQMIGVERSLLWKAAFPSLEEQFTCGQHVYQVLSNYGALVMRAEERVSAIIAQDSDEILHGLRVPPGTPLLSVVRVALAMGRQPVEHRTSRYRFDSVPGLYYDCVVC